MGENKEVIKWVGKNEERIDFLETKFEEMIKKVSEIDQGVKRIYSSIDCLAIRSKENEDKPK